MWCQGTQATTTSIDLADQTTKNVDKPYSILEFIEEQSTDDICKMIAVSIGMQGSQYSVEGSRFLIRQALINEAL